MSTMPAPHASYAQPIEMNPLLNAKQLHEIFRLNQRLHIPAFLESTAADKLHRHVSQDLEWGLFLRAEGRLWEIHPDERKKYTAEQEQELTDAAFSSALLGYTSFYDCRRGIPTDAMARADDPSLLARFLDLLNSESFLDFVRTLTGIPDIAYANAQATRYVPGHFITPHSDAQDLTTRRAAYVFNLTPEWKVEWGGLLQFFAPDGHVAEAYVPRFNAFNVFKVPQLHAVSLVSPFAGAARYSITGWFWARE